MCYSAGSISQAVNPCPMCKVFAHQKCPHIRETCRNRTAHPRMDVLYLRNAEVESFKGCGFCKWANQDPPSTKSGYNNPGWPGCCRPPYPDEVEKIPAADWPAVSKVHSIRIPPEVEDILKLILPPLTLKPGNIPQSPVGLRSPSRLASRKVNGVALSTTPSKSATKPVTITPNNRGRQGSVTPVSNNAPRSSSSTGISSSLPSSPSIDNYNSRRKASTASMDRRNGEGSSPSRKSVDPDYNSHPTSPQRCSSGRRPALTPATTSVSVSRIVASDTRSSESRLHHSPPSTPNRRGSSASNSPSMTPRSGDTFLVPRTPKADIDCRSSSSGSDGMLSDTTITSEGFTDYLSDESEEELQKQAEARAAVLAQNQMEELEFKMARQQLVRVGLEPPKTWTQTNTTAVSPTKSNINHSTMPSRNAKISAHSFAVAATAMMQTG